MPGHSEGPSRGDLLAAEMPVHNEAVRQHEAVRDFFSVPQRYLWTDFGIRVRTHLVHEMLGSVTGKRILDVGCGDGSLSLQFADEARQITLVDMSPEMLAEAQKRVPPAASAQVELINASLESFTPSAPYDVVLCVGVLAHVPSAETALQKVADCLEPGGRAIVQLTDISRASGWLNYVWCDVIGRLKDGRRHELKRTTTAGLLKVATPLGLELEGVRGRSLMLPGMGRLPNEWLYRYDLRVASNRMLSQLGSEALLLLRKRR